MKALAKKSYCGRLLKCPRVIVAKYMRVLCAVASEGDG